MKKTTMINMMKPKETHPVLETQIKISQAITEMDREDVQSGLMLRKISLKSK